ncbi:MAG: carbohydrate-binding domain-containing protein [Prevotella sp.]|nr:carbohydrate-binding domain-containing protein [Prevotella sp.]
MKKTLLLLLLAIVSLGTARGANTVTIVFSGTTATVTIDQNISNYVTLESGTSSHVRLTQAATFAGIDPTVDNTDGEITYALSGTSSDGEFRLEGAYKCTVELNGVTLTNPSGPAINLQNGKRNSVSAKKGTTSTLQDGTNADYNGALHCKGHLKLKGKGTLNIVGNSRHAIYAKEYCEVKNLTLNITAAVKDGIHCREYFLMESGTVSISGTGDDGIQVEQDTSTGSIATGETTDHEDENSGNFYMTGGTLAITGYGDKTIKADGSITFTGGTHNFGDMLTYAGISDVTATAATSRQADGIYDLQGRRLNAVPQRRSIYIVVENGRARKFFAR